LQVTGYTLQPVTCNLRYPFTKTNPPILTYTWRSGRIFGVPVELHWSFLLLPPAILYFSWIPDYGINWRAAGWWTAIALLLFAFVLIHELGHALMARNRGVQAEKIVLFPPVLMASYCCATISS